MNPDRLTKRIFIWDYNLCKNWCKEVKQLLELIECQDMFTNKLAGNLITVKWKHLLSTKPKLRTYVKFKENICTEDYVKHSTSRRKRSLMPQFRIGILPLHIETGRFRDKRIIERVCLWRMNCIFCVFAPPILTTGRICIQFLIIITF